MAKSDTQKVFTQKDIDKLVNEQNRAILVYEGDVYDATDFKVTHPGGPKYIDDFVGKDMTEAFYENEHTKIALRLLKEIKIGTLDSSTDKKISVSTNHSETRMKEIEDEAWRDLVDPAKGTVYQVFSKLNKEQYMKFINDPKHLTKPGDEHRMFQWDWIEVFSRTPWYYIGMFWGPVTLFKLWQSSFFCSPVEMLIYFLCGAFFWTFMEYTLHRFIFHMETYMPDNKFFIATHYMFHGVHHSFPMDKDRLVFPVVPAIIIYLGVYAMISSALPRFMWDATLAGIIGTYMLYDMGHYYLHHAQPLEVVQYRKKYHMYHHYKDPDNGYGITTSFWDIIFGTELDMSKKNTTKSTS